MSLRQLVAPLLVTAGLAAPLLAQADATERLQAMNRFYAELPKASATLLTELRLPSFPMANSDTQHAFRLDRKAGALAVRHTEGRPGASIVFDGKGLMASLDMSSRYLRDESKAGLDTLLDDPRLQGLPLPAMFLTRSLVNGPAIPVSRDATVEEVGDDLVEGVAARHIRVRGDMATDVWIAEGREPWLLKVKPQPPGGEDLPEGMDDAMVAQVTFVFRDWSAGPLEERAFDLTPPKGFSLAESLMPEMPGMGAAAEAHGGDDDGLPDLTLTSLDGTTRSLSDLRGDVVVLDFWATWCKPCLLGLPIVKRVTDEYAPKGVQFFAVDVREKPKRIKMLLEKKGWDLPVVLDSDGSIAQAFGVGPIPHTVILDAQGQVARVHVGFSDTLEATLRADLDAVLKTR